MTTHNSIKKILQIDSINLAPPLEVTRLFARGEFDIYHLLSFLEFFYPFAAFVFMYIYESMYVFINFI